MSILKHAMWTHGNSISVEYPDRILSIDHLGDRVHLQGKPGTTNWLHFAVPTPVITDNVRLRARLILFLFKSDGDSEVKDVHAYDGERRFKLAEVNRKDKDGWTWASAWIPTINDEDNLEAHIAVRYGIGISINVAFGAGGGQLEFKSAGCDFEKANHICNQRLPIYTDKQKLLEFPYCSNHPIDIKNQAITRILISIHGTGGDAERTLEDTLEAGRLYPGALGTTLVISPQFVDTRESYQLRDHGSYGRALFWPSGRAYGAQSAELDLDGDGVPDSGTISSFTAMDTLLTSVNRADLFPNLKSIVLTGHSNGGQFLNHYAAIGRFEDEFMSTRPVKIRYVVMNPGAYLYFDEKRPTAGYPSPFEVPNSTNCPNYNRYRFGLKFDGPTQANYPYVTRVGAEAILEKYPGRNVVYLLGEKDTDGNWICEDLLQGKNRFERGQIYWDHLRNTFPGINTTQSIRVVEDIGHNGRLLMRSDAGQELIFGPID